MQIRLLEIKIKWLRQKNTLEEINGRLNTVDKRISELEDITIETIKNGKQRGKKE